MLFSDGDANEFFISRDYTLTYKENFKKGFHSRIRNVFILMLALTGGGYVGILGLIYNNIRPAGYVLSILAGILLAPIFVPLILLGLLIGGLYGFFESLIFPFAYLFATIKDSIERKIDDFTIQSVSRSEVKVNYRFKNHLFHHPFKAIESHIDTLDLSSNDLTAKPISEVISLLKSIPLSIRHLNLARNGLNKGMSNDKLREIYLALPSHLESLDLSGQQFPNTDLLTALPGKLRTLKLNDCQIKGDELSKMLPLFPASLISLEVRGNPSILFNFSPIAGALACKKLKLDMSCTEFTTKFLHPRSALTGVCTNFLVSLPNEVTALDFKYSNFLENITGIELPKQLTELSSNVSVLESARRCMFKGLSNLKVLKLELSPQGYKYKKGSKYTPGQSLLEWIPQTVIELDLTHNYLGELNEDALISLLKTLPKHIRIIHLDHNGLFQGKTITEADALFKKITAAVTSCQTDPEKPDELRAVTPTLHLSNGNGYNVASQFGLLLTPPLKLMYLKLPAEHREASLLQIPKSVTTLDLSDNQLGQLNAQALLELLGHIPEHVRVVVLDNNELFNHKTPVQAEALFTNVLKALPLHPTLGKPTLHLSKGNWHSFFTTHCTEPQSSVQHLPYRARNLIYEFLGGQETEVEVRPSRAKASGAVALSTEGRSLDGTRSA